MRKLLRHRLKISVIGISCREYNVIFFLCWLRVTALCNHMGVSYFFNSFAVEINRPGIPNTGLCPRIYSYVYLHGNSINSVLVNIYIQQQYCCCVGVERFKWVIVGTLFRCFVNWPQKYSFHKKIWFGKKHD